MVAGRMLCVLVRLLAPRAGWRRLAGHRKGPRNAGGGPCLLGCRSELLQLRVHALLDLASGAAQEHRREISCAWFTASLEVLEVDILWPRWVARIGVTHRRGDGSRAGD